MKKIRIVEGVNQLGLGGTEYTLQLFSKFLDKSRFDVTVVALKEGGERVKLIEEMGIKVILLNGNLNLLPEILKQADVFHWHGSGLLDQELFEIIRLNKPEIVIQTNVFGAYEPNPLYNSIDYDLYISKMVLVRRMQQDRKLPENFSNKRYYLPNPIDVAYLVNLIPSETEIAAFKKEHKLDGYFIAGRIGRADDHKFDLITLDAFAEFARDKAEARFLLLGATKKMRAHAEKLNITDKLLVFENTADIRKLLYYYKSMDVFIAASQIGESFGMVIAEAMTAEIPVITISTENRDNAQIELVDNGKTGLVTKRDHFKIAAAIQRIYSDEGLRHKITSTSRQKIISHYQADKVTRALEKLILEHFSLPLSDLSPALPQKFSKEMLWEYKKRCIDLYGRSLLTKKLLWARLKLFPKSR